MDVITGAFQIAAVVIAVSGLAKLRSPGPFAALLRSIGLPGGPLTARVAGLVELVLGAAAVLVGGPVLAAAVGAAYLVFAGAIVAARRSGTESCGCFGAASAPPSAVHLVVNLLAAAIAIAAALAGGPPGLWDVLVDQPVAGIPYLISLAAGAGLVIVLDTAGARVFDGIRSLAPYGPTFRENAPGARTSARRPT